MEKIIGKMLQFIHVLEDPAAQSKTGTQIQEARGSVQFLTVGKKGNLHAQGEQDAVVGVSN
jgi:hypothetical protein